MAAKGRNHDDGRIERTRDAVSRLREAGLSQADIARELGLTKSTVAYHFRTLGSSPGPRFSRRYDWQEIQRACDSGLSVRECARRFGFTLASWHQATKRNEIRARPAAMPIENLLVDGRLQTNRSHLKMRLIAAGLKEDRCERCGLEEWQGRPLRMQLHHINGKGKDNRLENLELLCPNCHAQTENWGGRNGHRRRRAAPGSLSPEPAAGSRFDRRDSGRREGTRPP